MSKVSTESNDQSLAEDLVFKPNGLTLLKVPRGTGFSPDFQVILNEKQVAFCEMKSPRDDWLESQLAAASLSMIVGGLRDDPIFNRIRRHATKAAKQFNAANPTRAMPNILIFVNHDDAAGFGDVRETFTGIFHAKDGSCHSTMSHIASSLDQAKEQLDLCVWIDGKVRRVEGYLFNQAAIPDHLDTLCILFGKNPRDIKK